MTKNSTVDNRHGSAVVTTPSDTEILITRQFDAPAALIFRAWTEPDLVKQWWGFETGKWLVCDVDLRVGGQWRWVVMVGDMEVGFHGEYREIDAPHRLVTTEIYEGAPDASAVNIMTLEEVDGVTTLTVLAQHENKEQRDAVIESGMEGGMQVSMNRMEDLARDLASR
jgi:uncharacterized protein YndB with AHSA1/START domain